MCAGRTDDGQTFGQIVARQGIERQREMDRLAREREAVAAQQQAQLQQMQAQQQQQVEQMTSQRQAAELAQQQQLSEIQGQQRERIAGINATGQAVTQSLRILAQQGSQAPTAQATGRAAGVVAPRQATAALKIGATRRAAGSGANVAV